MARNRKLWYKTKYMNKDALLASGIGFGIGLVITGAILLGPTLITQLTTRRNVQSGDVQSASQTAGNTVNNQNGSTGVTIDSPAAESILTENTVEISGKASEGTTIVIAGDVDETVVTVDSSGMYKGTIGLKEGKNEISVSGIQDGKPTVQKQILFYTP